MSNLENKITNTTKEIEQNAEHGRKVAAVIGTSLFAVAQVALVMHSTTPSSNIEGIDALSFTSYMTDK